MPSFGNNPALSLYRNLEVEKGDDTDVKATRGLLARGQANKVRKERLRDFQAIPHHSGLQSIH